MADLPTNTSYGGDRNPNTAYAAAKKAIMERFTGGQAQAQQPAGWQPSKTRVNWGPGQQPVANIPYAMPTVDPAQPQVAAPQKWTNNATGEVVTSYVPPDYKTVPGEAGKFNNPSDIQNLRFRNVPENLGGGQYVTDTEQRGSMIRSQRGVRPDQYEGSRMEYPSDTVGSLNKEILGGFKPASDRSHGLGFQIDHIVPLWLGGADTPENKQLLDPFTHEKKTKVQAVALTLLQAGKITADQAKMMAIPWREKDDSAITTFNNGFVDLKEAERIAQKWQEDSSKPAPVKWSNVWDELKNLKNFGQETLGSSAPAAFIREFVKGGASSLTFGYIPYEMDDDYNDGVAKMSGFAGTVAGNVVGLLAPMRAIGMVGGLMNVGLKKVGLMAKIAGAGGSMVKEIGMAKGGKTTIDLLAKLAPKEKGSALLYKALQNAGLFTVYGQLSKEGLLGQTLTGEENHWGSRMLWDIATGGAMGKWSNPSKAAKEAAKVTLLTTGLDAMLRADDPDWDIRSSLSTGLTMGGLHYLFLKGGAGRFGPKEGGITPHSIDRKIISEQFTPQIKSGLFSVAKYNPKIKSELSKGISSDVLELEIEKAQKEMAKRITDKYGESAGDQDYDSLSKQYIINLFEARRAYIKTLPENEQFAAQVEDLSSLMSHVYKNEPVQDTLTKILNTAGEKLNPTVPRIFGVHLDETKLTDGSLRIPLAGTAKSGKIKQNLETAQQLNKDGLLGGEGVLVLRKEQGALINAAVRARGGNEYTNPENLIEAWIPYYKDKTKTSLGGWLHIGNIPEKSHLESFNTGNPKYTEFKSELGNKDIVGQQMSENGEVVKKFDLEWFDPKSPIKGTSGAIVQIKPDASERSKIFNDAFIKTRSERTINDSVSGITEKKLSEAGMEVTWMNGVVAEFKHALTAGDAVSTSETINKIWGKKTITPEGAQAILDNPTFTIGDMFKILKNSPWWKRAAYILDPQMRPSKEAAVAFKEYQNTNIKAQPKVADIKTELPSAVRAVKGTKKVPSKKINANEVDESNFSENQADYVFPSKAVTLGGADVGEIAPKKYKAAAKTVKASKPQVAKKKVPEGVSEALAGAVKAVKESPLAKQSKVSPEAPEMPQIMQKERTRPLSRISQTDASTGQNTPVSRTPQAVSAKTTEIAQPVEPTVKKSLSEEAKNRYLTEAEMNVGIKKKKTFDKPKMSDISERDIEAHFDDIMETKILSLKEKFDKDPESVYKSALSALENEELKPPENSSQEFAHEFKKLQEQVKKRVAAKYSETLLPQAEKTAGEEGGGFFKRWEPTEQQKLEGGKQAIAQWKKLAEDAQRKIKNGEKIGFIDSFATMMNAGLPKVFNPDYAPRGVANIFINKMLKEHTDTFGRPKSQNVDYINKRIAEQRKTGMPIDKGFGDKIFENVQKERRESKTSGEISQENLDSGGTFDVTSKLVGGIEGETNLITREDLRGMKMNGVRQKDEAYDWMIEAEYSMPEMAVYFRKGADNPVDGLVAAKNLLANMINDSMRAKQRPSNYIDLMSVYRKTMKDLNINGLGTIKAVKEDVENIHLTEDQKLVQKIREWQNRKRQQEASPKVKEAVAEVLAMIEKRKSNK